MTDSPQDELLAEVQRSVMQSRMIYYRQMTKRQDVTDSLHRELAVNVMQYADALPLSQVTVEAADIEKLRQAIGQTTVVQVEAPGDTSNTKPVQRPAVLSFDASDLVAISKQLDDIAADLGFGPDVDTRQRGPER